MWNGHRLYSWRNSTEFGGWSSFNIHAETSISYLFKTNKFNKKTDESNDDIDDDADDYQYHDKGRPCYNCFK